MLKSELFPLPFKLCENYLKVDKYSSLCVTTAMLLLFEGGISLYQGLRQLTWKKIVTMKVQVRYKVQKMG